MNRTAIAARSGTRRRHYTWCTSSTVKTKVEFESISIRSYTSVAFRSGTIWYGTFFSTGSGFNPVSGPWIKSPRTLAFNHCSPISHPLHILKHLIERCTEYGVKLRSGSKRIKHGRHHAFQRSTASDAVVGRIIHFAARTSLWHWSSRSQPFGLSSFNSSYSERFFQSLNAIYIGHGLRRLAEHFAL